MPVFSSRRSLWNELCISCLLVTSAMNCLHNFARNILLKGFKLCLFPLQDFQIACIVIALLQASLHAFVTAMTC